MTTEDRTNVEPTRTRAEEQRHVNDLYVRGSMTRDEWRYATDRLSDLSLWTAEGKVKK
jgi:hypothetical protein